jgi:hypothetical protein
MPIMEREVGRLPQQATVPVAATPASIDTVPTRGSVRPRVRKNAATRRPEGPIIRRC